SRNMPYITTIVPNITQIAHDKIRQSIKLSANAGTIASMEPSSIPVNCGCGSTVKKWLNGSAADQYTPPPANNVLIIIEIHLNVLISGLSILPKRIFPYLRSEEHTSELQ